MGLSNKLVGSMVFVLLVVVVYGCDIISPKTQKSVQTPVATAPQSVVTPKETTTSNKIQEPQEALPANVLAKVGSWSITLDEFNERLVGLKKVLKDFDEKTPGIKKMVLQELVRQQLLVHEARLQKIDEMKDIKAAVSDFESTLMVQEYANRLVKDAAVSQQEARDYYMANPDQFVMPAEKQLREIVVPTEVEAKDILVRILQNGDFMQIAKEKSKGKTAAEGGDLGFVLQAPFPQMQKEIESLKKGEVSRVFSGPDGYYIVKVESIRGGDKKTFDEVKEQLAKWLLLKKQQDAVLQKVEEIANKVNVQVNADLLKE